MASRVLFILQAGYFKAKTLFFSFEIDEVADDVKHVLQQHYPQYHDTALKSAIVKQTRYAQQRKLLELYAYHACAGDERAALSARADQVVRISAKPIYVFQADYYTVQKLQQLTQGMARLYLLCFLLQRYQRINDNLINALIYQVRKVLSAAKVCLQERLLSDRMEGSKNVHHIGQILDLFLDDSIADSVSFGESSSGGLFPSWNATKLGAQRTSSAPTPSMSPPSNGSS
jgi:hypothetical protein